MKKSTLYIDAEDDIAAVIDKIKSQSEKIVALVLPKRAQTFQSSVNVRLIKKAADEAGKSIVLVTTEDVVVSLAGVAGLYAASNLQSKPSIPISEPQNLDTIIEIRDDSGQVEADILPDKETEIILEDQDIDIDPSTPIGELIHDDADDNTIALDNDDPEEKSNDAVIATDAEKQEKPPKKDKKLIVPSFDAFRKKSLLAVVTVFALVGFTFYAIVIAPKATVTIKTQQSDVSTKAAFIIDSALTASAPGDAKLVAIQKQSVQKITESFLATGQKDIGTKATGTVTFRNCESSSSIIVPAGTGISKGGVTFITQSAGTSPGGTFSGGGSNCNPGISGEVKVVAQVVGDQYNLAAGSYAVAGDLGKITALGSAMSGGTTKIVKVVTASDLEVVREKILRKIPDNTKGQLMAQLATDGVLPFMDSFTSSVGDMTSSVSVDGEASGDIIASIDVTATMLGARKTDLDTVLAKSFQKSINPATQKLYSTGIDKAIFVVTGDNLASSAQVEISSTGRVGPVITPESVKDSIKGLKAGEAKKRIESTVGVKEASIKLQPFWVFSMPKSVKKINVVFDEGV